MLTNVKNGNLVLIDIICDGLKLDEPPIAPPGTNEADLDPNDWISMNKMHMLIELYQFWPLDSTSTKMLFKNSRTDDHK